MKLVLQLILVILIISTISVCMFRPELHKNIVVYDSAYTLVPEQEVKTESKDIPVMEIKKEPVQKTVTVEQKVEPVQKITSKQELKKIQTLPATTTKTLTTKTQNKTTIDKQIQTTSKPVNTNIVKPTVKEIQKEKFVKETKNVEPTKTEEKEVNKNIVQPVTTLTQQEETIAWNKWRSELTNKIMQDTKLPDIPNGVVFQFSFTVDKYGKVSNVQTGANPANYTPFAIQYIAPVIRSYQGHSILTFPNGTERTSTQVTGKWRISNTSKYSTPQDYNDVERIIR